MVQGTVVQEAEFIIKRKNLEEAFSRELSKFKPGDKVLIRFELREPLPVEAFEELRQNLSNSGLSGEVEETMTIPDYVSIKFEVPLAVGVVWLALLIPIIPAILMWGMIGFGIFKAESIIKALTPILLIGGGLAVVALVLWKKK